MKKIIRILMIVGFCLFFVIMLLIIIKLTLISNTNTVNTMIANISTFVMSFFTITYVIINNNILLQSKKDFSFSNKPLPYINKSFFCIEEPKIWANPLTKNVLIYSRYSSLLIIKNISPDSALCVDIKSSLYILQGKKIIKTINSICKYYSKIESNEELKVEFSFPMDTDNVLVHSFNNESGCDIIFENIIYFRNYLGNPFKTSFMYILNTDAKNDSVITDLSKKIISYQSKYKNKLETISKYILNNIDWKKEYDEIANEINKEKMFYPIEPVEIPIEKILEPLTYKKYKKIRQKLNHCKIVKGKTNKCGSMLVN